MPIGKLYGIGVGPGDPELISVKGVKVLQTVAVVAFPAGERDKPGIAEQIVGQWIRPEQVKLPLRFPFVRDPAVLREAWIEAAIAVWEFLQQGRDVAFVSEGDISFYSTFTYLAQMVKQQHPEVEVRSLPGICSPLAAAAELGIPLTLQGQKLAVLPALYEVEELETALNWADVVVLMKFSSVYLQVWELLQRRGLLERTYIVEKATWEGQKIYRGLSDRRDLKLPYFSLAIVQVVPISVMDECNG